MCLSFAHSVVLTGDNCPNSPVWFYKLLTRGQHLALARPPADLESEEACPLLSQTRFGEVTPWGVDSRPNKGRTGWENWLFEMLYCLPARLQQAIYRALFCGLLRCRNHRTQQLGNKTSIAQTILPNAII